jgi:hypothetical protein
MSPPRLFTLTFQGILKDPRRTVVGHSVPKRQDRSVWDTAPVNIRHVYDVFEAARGHTAGVDIRICLTDREAPAGRIYAGESEVSVETVEFNTWLDLVTVLYSVVRGAAS